MIGSNGRERRLTTSILAILNHCLTIVLLIQMKLQFMDLLITIDKRVLFYLNI